ncbi:apolipoprotein N-acyltransferase [Psychroflexus planctonicus]|uniref:apolipoprotein N-acyltransferase n=1 Tax=Psychroflexus planctonicus TaxID=1526575 RepID=UPI00166BFF35|nr:apolipoprotein N-acyltransferase [Psychroflexus planctonicus]
MKNLLLAILSGFLFAVSWPTYGFVFFLFFAFVPLLWAELQLRQKNTRKLKIKVFGLAYLTFLIWNFATTSWLYYSDPFGMFFAVLVNSLLMSLVFLLYHIVAKRVNFTAASSFFIAIWICFEYLHLHWEFSWPWLNLGNAFSENTALIQWYEYTGTFGGTLWVLIANILVLKAILLFQQHKDKAILVRSSIKLILFVGIPIGISFLIKSNLDEAESHIEVIALQPNVDPYSEKYHTDDEAIKKKLLKLVSEEIKPTTDLVLLPETVFAQGTRFKNFQISEAHDFSQRLISDFPNVSVLGGISAYDILENESEKSHQSNLHPRGFWYNDYNAAFFEKANQTTEFYYKSKLVVGVENFPYQSVLRPILGDVMLDLGGTVAMKTTQVERSAYSLNNGVKVAPIICYESVYGEYVSQYVQNGAEILAIMTNDAWWAETQGHKQHWSYAKLRAIETRKAVARSANTGISGFIDADGTEIKKTKYNQLGLISGKIPVYKKETFYVKSGDYIARVAQFLAIFIFLFAVVKFKRSGVKR